jgi:hypothetical protein
MSVNQYGLNNQVTNTVTVYKGKINDIPILAWDFISPCIREKCGIFTRCRFAQGEGIYQLEQKYSHVLDKYCTTQKRYVDKIFDTLIYSNRDTLTAEDSLRLGLMVMPMFGHLIKLKIAEASFDQILFEDSKGMKKINPIYREIRETVKSISAIMNELGMGGVELPNAQDFTHGDPTYYDRMYGDEGGEEGNGTTAEVKENTNGEAKKRGRPKKRSLNR